MAMNENQNMCSPGCACWNTCHGKNAKKPLNRHENVIIEFVGYNDEYKGDIAVDYNARKIIFFGNNTEFHKNSYTDKVYNQITIKNRTEEIVKKIIINGDDSMTDIIQVFDLKEGIMYEEGLTIELNMAEPSRTFIRLNGCANLTASPGGHKKLKICGSQIHAYETSIMSFYGENYHRGDINLNQATRKITFFGLTWAVSCGYIGQMYYKITIKDKRSEIVKQIIINGNDSMAGAICKNNLGDGIHYEQGYVIEVETAEVNRLKVRMNRSDTYTRVNNTTMKFLIIDDQIMSFDFYKQNYLRVVSHICELRPTW